jgi:hypothetical protein
MDDDVAHERDGGVRVSGGTVVRAWMAGAIDYAGLFPPAGLSMSAAVKNHASYRAGPNAWMLGRFILPVARLEEFADAFAGLPDTRVPSGRASPGENSSQGGGSPWLLSVIARASDAAALAAFNARYGSRARIDTIETPPVRAGDLDAIAPLTATYTVYAEVPWADDPAPLIAMLAPRGIRAKLRTGGVTPDAIPPAAAVARFIAACGRAKVPFKATAGLHHAGRGEYPLTYEAGSATATMHGFLNVMLAAMHGAGGEVPERLAGMLEGRDPTFHAADGLESGAAAARLLGMQSFGSCSFEEPVAELTARGLL